MRSQLSLETIIIALAVITLAFFAFSHLKGMMNKTAEKTNETLEEVLEEMSE